MSPIILADALVIALREMGVEYVFGVGGANIEHVHDAIHRLGDGRLVSVLAKREDGAANMADGLARVHRRLGVCCATSGGGMMNLVAGLAESYAESVPVLALIGQPPTALAGAGAFQDSSGIGQTVDAEGLLRAATKKVLRVSSGIGFWGLLRDAVDTAMSGRPGPVAVLLPRDVCTAEVAQPPAGWSSASTSLPSAVPDAAAVARLDLRLRSARAPVLLLGHGVRRSPAATAVQAYAARAGLPVAVTMGGRAEFPSEDPLFLGILGVAGNPSVAEYVSERADLVVAVGTGITAMTRSAIADWDSGRTVAVNIDPDATLWRGVADDVVVGDAGEVFEALGDSWKSNPYTAPPPVGYVRTRFAPRSAESWSDSGDVENLLTQSSAVRAIDGALKPRTNLFFDAGNCAVAAMHYSDVPPGGTSTIALGMGGMGYAFGAALGAALGSAPGVRTLAFCGDGAFLMSGMEVHTAAEHEAAVLYLVFNNGAHGMCATRQRAFFDGRLEAVGYHRPDIVKVAEGLAGPDRLWAGRARTVAELESALQEYLSGPVATGVLELVLDREEIPPFTPFLRADERVEPVWPNAMESAR